MTWKVLRCLQCNISQDDMFIDFEVISKWCVIFYLRLSRRMVSFCSLQRHIAIDVSWSGFTMQWQELVELRRIPELHLSNCAWNWYQFKSCFCICVHVLYDVAIYQRHSTQSVWYANAIRHGILARQIQTTKKAGDYQGMLWRVSLDWWNATLGFCFFGRSWDISCVQSSLTLHYSWTLLIPLSNRIQNHYAYYIIYYI